MRHTLQTGGNRVLASFAGTVIVSHDLDPKLDINLTAFLLTESGKVQHDGCVVFYNQPQGPGGAATFAAPQDTGHTRRHQIDFDLKKLPADIVKIAVTLTEDLQAGFAAARNLQAEVHVGGEVVALMPGSFATEKGLIVLELYIRNDQPRAKAVWQGFSSGLHGLCRHYGVDVDEEQPPAAPAPLASSKPTPSGSKPSSPASASPASASPEPVKPAAASKVAASTITLTKESESHRVTLQKGDGAPRKILVSATWVDNGDGLDNDDLDLRVGILLPDGRMKIIQAPDKAGAFSSDPYVFHRGDVTTASVSAPGMETVEINPEISLRLGGRVALVCSVYSAVSNGVVSVASLKPKMRMEYGDQVVECALTFKKRFGSSCIYTYVIGLIEIDQTSIILRPSGVTSRFMSEATPWLEWGKDSVKLTMDGPAVFKGSPPSESGKKRYS